MTNPLRRMNKKKQAFVRLVVAGLDEKAAVLEAYPGCKNPDVRAAILLYDPEVRRGIELLARHGTSPEKLRIQLNCIITSEKSKPAEKLRAIEMIREMDGLLPPDKKKDKEQKRKKAVEAPPNEDAALAERLDRIGKIVAGKYFQ